MRTNLVPRVYKSHTISEYRQKYVIMEAARVVNEILTFLIATNKLNSYLVLKIHKIETQSSQ